MARPKRGNFATGEAGLARYKEALKKYLAKTKKTTKPEVKKPVAKKPVAKKPATKKPAAKKPVAKKPVAKKPVAKKPAITKTTTRPKRTANNLKIKKAANTAAKTTKQVIKKATPVVKKAASTVRKKAGEAKKVVTKKVDQVKKTFNMTDHRYVHGAAACVARLPSKTAEVDALTKLIEEKSRDRSRSP